ncbi:sensor histidine kinase [Pontibacter fetidus]|uniref:histidine kinase n=1 Tax=Pontibacter fetidus TaxID=2700082 RepID=A0A6B2GXU1_9BACT|nr:PAS domain-containing sensor histidine kinase [Pontibacter fetidus]NDK55665.1 PAS domain S-box protein [Pontibacter fetidus]
MDPNYYHVLSNHFISQVKEYAIFAMDTKGVITTWNLGAERIKGYTEEEAVGKYYGMLFCEEDQARGKPEEELELTKLNGKHEDEWWRRKKDGSAFWANVSLNAIYNNNNELVGFTKVTKDLTDRKIHEDTLTKKNEELSKVNKDLDHFIYIASHDLKAPILNIEALVNYLREGFENKCILREEDAIKLFDHIQASVHRFKDTVEDLTTINRLQRSLDDNKNSELINVQEVFDSVLADMTYLFDKFQIPCRIDTKFEVTELNFSRANFRSILYNLVSNAIKYRSNTHACKISVRTMRSEQGMVLKVKDNGLGISKQNQAQLYTMFKRFHSHVDGSGIGLYITKRIIDNAGGSIEINSDEGEGTEFRVYFKD